jgi:hypothetical protein
MKTPFGKECPYFYGDYYRGKNHEECRLLVTRPSSTDWSSTLCKNCPVPGIKTANSCPTMTLTAEIKKGLLGFNRHMKISAFCSRSQSVVKVPEVGCGVCHPISEFFSSK